eukprot:scaffold92055_cov33-Tisochrysis_lutea.AAC.6
MMTRSNLSRRLQYSESTLTRISPHSHKTSYAYRPMPSQPPRPPPYAHHGYPSPSVARIRRSCFGSAVESSGSTETGYILFYQATTWDGEAGNLGSEESSLRNLSRVYGDAPAQLDGERNGRQAPSRMEGSSASSHEDSVVSSMSVVSP